MTREEALELAWASGNLSYLVLEHQEILWNEIQKIIKSDNDRIYPWIINCARRFGKSTLGFLSLVQECIIHPRTSYLFCAPTEGNADEIVRDISPILFEEAPDAYRPEFKKGRYTFPNGSEIRIGGAYNGGETLRGRSAHGAIIDEAAFVKQTSASNGLKYVMESIIKPQLLTTNGFLLIQSTPPPVLAHDYVEVHNKMLAKGRVSTFTVHQNTSLDADRLKELEVASYESDPTGGTWKREYLAKFAVDERLLIIPNWKSEFAVSSYERPPEFTLIQRLVSYDHGTTDLGVFLFGYWDWTNAVLVIESSLSSEINGIKQSTGEISKSYKETRYSLWEDMSVMKEICDSINPQVIIDFNKEHGHRFVPPSKTNREAMVNGVINLVQKKQLVILDNESNKLLIKTLEQGVWKMTGQTRDFARLPGIGHCDAIAALMYMVRGINKYHNPYNYHKPLASNELDLRKPINNTSEAVLSNAFQFNRKKQFGN